MSIYRFYCLFGRRSAISLSHSSNFMLHTWQMHTHTNTFIQFQLIYQTLHDRDCTHFQAMSIPIGDDTQNTIEWNRFQPCYILCEENESIGAHKRVKRTKNCFLYFQKRSNRFQLSSRNEPNLVGMNHFYFSSLEKETHWNVFWKCVIDDVWYHYHNINIFIRLNGSWI